MIRSAGRASTWLLGLLAAALALRLAATGDLASPPVGSPRDLTDWVDQRAPAAASVAVVRLVAEVGVWYVLVVSALHVASSSLRLLGGHRIADALTIPAVRRALHAGLGLGLAAVSSVGGRDDAVHVPGTATMRPVEPPMAGQLQSEDRGGSATMRPAAPSQTRAPRTASPPTTWTVSEGDSLWSIAEELLADGWERPPSDGEVDPFWRSLIERNRGRLVDPGDPDLIHPGQVLEVPALPSPIA